MKTDLELRIKEEEENRLALVDALKGLEYQKEMCEDFIQSYMNDEAHVDNYNYWAGRAEGMRKAIKILKIAFAQDKYPTLTGCNNPIWEGK